MVVSSLFSLSLHSCRVDLTLCHTSCSGDKSSVSRGLSGPVRDTPPYRAIPFRDSIAEGGIAPICLVFIGYRASIAEIPPLRGGIAPPLRMLSKGETLRKGEGVSHPIGHVETPKN